MGRIYLDEKKKLVVVTDNGCIDGDGNTTTEIQEREKYEVSVRTIQELLTIVNKQITKYESEDDVFTTYYRKYNSGGYCIIMSPNDFAKKLKSVEEEKKEIEEELYDARNELEKIKNGEKPPKTEVETITETCEKAQSTMGWALFFMIVSLISMIVGFVF